MAWVTIANDDQQVSLATARTLARSDLDTLCGPHEWMTDSLIDYGVTVHGIPQHGPPARRFFHSNVAWISPATVKLGKDGNAEAFEASLGRNGVLGPRTHLDTAVNLPGGANVILFPVNDGDRHWSLLAFYKAGRKFVHYDSLQPANDAAAQALIDKLHTKNYLSRRMAFETPAELQRQADGYSCGVYVVSFARMIMASGLEPDGVAVGAVTSDTCDRLREDLLVGLQPLVAVELPMARHPDLPSSSSDYTPSLIVAKQVKDEERAKALEQAVAQLKKNLAEEEPLPLPGVVGCKEQKPTTLVVVLVSTDPKLQDVEGGSVTFAIGGQRFTRRAAYGGGGWATGIKLQVKEPTKVEVTGMVAPGPEFTAAQAKQEVELAEGDERTLELRLTPKPPRRFFGRFVLADPPRERQPESEDEVVIEIEPPRLRPFPKGYAVELVLDDGPDVVRGTLAADGTCVSAEDGEPGIRVLHRYASVWPRFTGGSKDEAIEWVAATDEDAPTTLVDPTTFMPLGRARSGVLPKGRWGPAPGLDWTLPKAHEPVPRQPRRKLDVSKLPRTIGSADAPLTYVLDQIPKVLHMNGHPIEHVVVLMLENRGFDHFMGYLYEGKDQPRNSFPAAPKGKHASLRKFEGMEGLAPVHAYDYHYEQAVPGPRTLRHPTGTTVHVPRHIEGKVRPRKGARACNVPRVNPHEDFIHIFQQMYGKDVVPEFAAMRQRDSRNALVKSGGKYKTPTMTGFAHNYCDGIMHHKGHGTLLTHEMVSEIVDIYLPDQLPVMSGLARHYAVSDLWFCSVPSQTNTNRAFWVAGSAAGEVTNAYYPAYPKLEKATGELHADQMPEGGDDGMLHRRCLFDVLEENDVEWRYYWSSHWPPKPISGNYFKCMFPQLADKGHNANVPLIKQFYADAAAGTLPPVAYLEPTWGGGAHWDAGAKRMVGNEFHPVQDMTNGEMFVKQVYEAIASSPKWDTTLLVITFDENGGTYDHMPPWEAVPTGREPEVVQFGFEFDCYGVRVPTLLISKHIKPGTIFRSPTAVPFDHTSIIATILKWQQIPKDEWLLGDRVDQAPTFDEVLEGADEDDERRTHATGVSPFDGLRTARIAKAQGLSFGDTVVLRYVGNKWTVPPPDALDHVGGPVSSMNYWYPVVTRDPEAALVFRIEGGEGPLLNGSKIVLEVDDGDAAGYSLAVPETVKATTIYLYKGGTPSKWVVWLVNDRTEGIPLHADDEVILFAERYLPENLTTGSTFYDPYQRLTIDLEGGGGTRYLKWRAGEWDLWRMQRRERV